MIPGDFAGKGKVAVLHVKPETILADVTEVMHLAGYREALPDGKDTVLGISALSQTWHPAASTTPWQLEGVIRALRQDGFDRLLVAQGGGDDAAAKNNKHRYLTDKYDIETARLHDPVHAWVPYTPRDPFIALDRLFPDGVMVPDILNGTNCIPLPTVTTHPLTAIAGAMHSAGDLLLDQRHHSPLDINAALVDLLQLRQDIHSGLFAVMDGTFAGTGANVRETDLMLASADLVAIDAISARIQGLDPMELPFIRLAHEKGLGIGDPTEIEIVGQDISAEDWHAGQVNAPTSGIRHNVLRNPVADRMRVQSALTTKWGQLFRSYGNGKVVLPGPDPAAVAIAAGTVAALTGAAWMGLRSMRSGRCR